MMRTHLLELLRQEGGGRRAVYQTDRATSQGQRYRLEEVRRLLCDLDLPALYRRYTQERGFPGVYRLEQEMTAAAKTGSLGPDHVQRLACPDEEVTCADPLPVTLYIGDVPAYWLTRQPEATIRPLRWQVRGAGPTTLSRLLRFAVPQVFGAVDPWLVRVFGRGDPGTQRYRLFDLQVTRSGGRWTIPAAQPGWPGEYGVWVRTLQAIARLLNREEVCCPHTEPFLRAGLRDRGIWAAADVEIALSGYAREVVQGAPHAPPGFTSSTGRPPVPR